MKKSYKFRIYPTHSQETLLMKTFGCVRFLWNKQVSAFNEHIVVGPRPKVQSKQLKDVDSFSFLNEVSATALQQKDMDFIEFKKQYFNKKRKKKLGRPQHKKRGKNDSFRLPNQKFSLDQTAGRIRLEKIGKVKVICDRIIPKDVEYRNVTVSKNRAGEFYVQILVDEEIEVKPTTGRQIRIDLGFIDLLTCSTGTVMGNPRWFRKNQAKLARSQKQMARKVKGSNRRNKQRLKVAKIHQKISRQRNWYLHQVQSWLVNNFDTIIMEDLNLEGMKKLFGKSVQDAGLSTLVSQIAYKSNWYGRTFHKVDRFFASSKTCNVCGTKTTFGLDVREWKCDSCGTIHDRDLNAAVNILKQGLTDLYEYTSDELAEVVRRNSNENERGEVIRLHSLDLSKIHSNVAVSEKRLADFYEFA